jgi:hypothetical protein
MRFSLWFLYCWLQFHWHSVWSNSKCGGTVLLSLPPCCVQQTSEPVLLAFDVCYSSSSTGRRVKRGNKAFLRAAMFMAHAYKYSKQLKKFCKITTQYFFFPTEVVDSLIVSLVIVLPQHQTHCTCSWGAFCKIFSCLFSGLSSKSLPVFWVWAKGFPRGHQCCLCPSFFFFF